MPTFQYHPQIIEKFPNIVGGVIIASGLTNQPTPEAVKAFYQEEQAAVKQRIGATPLSEINSLSAWRQTFSAFGVAPTKYRNAAESLLRRLTKKGDIPSINLLVDLGNLVSIRYGLPTAVFDTQFVDGVVTVHFADGTEHYKELGSEEQLHPEVGEVVFTDEKKMVIARRWCWRQSAESAATLDTQNVIITTEAQHADSLQTVQHAVNDLLTYFQQYAGGTYEHAILSAENPAI